MRLIQLAEGLYVSGGVTPWKIEYCEMTASAPPILPHTISE